MKSTQKSLARGMHGLVGHEVRYERSFLLDMKTLEPAAFQQIQRFVFQDFYDFIQLQDLSEFRQLDTSGIFYRFTLDRYLVSLEVTGRIIKFLRVLPKPEV